MGRGRILAVDNAVMFLNTLKRLLEGSSYELDCLTSAGEALKYLENNKPDIILLDIEMPEMDGYELARKIKQRGHAAPIIFITANSARQNVDKAIEVGASGLLMKPLDPKQLRNKLREVL
jgi:CheY-like chemotaxis protein